MRRLSLSFLRIFQSHGITWGWRALLLGCIAIAPRPCLAAAPPMQRIVVAPNSRGFMLAQSHQPFHPWGFNYGRSHLLEHYWIKHWPTVVRDFHNMKAMGANVVRVHLQYGRFMRGPNQPDRRQFKALAALLALAQRTGLYLDITGLGCYRRAATPKWYNAMDQRRRWAAQETFWRLVAAECASSPAVFCYDLVNEPLSPAGQRPPGAWQPNSSFGGYDFLQYIALKPGPGGRKKLAVRWIQAMTRAIRLRDKHTLITVGLLPWVKGWKWLSGFVPRVIAPHLDFISVHIYPNSKDLSEAMIGLRKCAVGKPVVIEETFPLSCSPQQEQTFLLQSRAIACGWLGHYNGKTIAQYQALARQGRLSIAQALYLAWERMFVKLGPRFVNSRLPTREP